MHNNLTQRANRCPRHSSATMQFVASEEHEEECYVLLKQTKICFVVLRTWQLYIKEEAENEKFETT